MISVWAITIRRHDLLSSRRARLKLQRECTGLISWQANQTSAIDISWQADMRVCISLQANVYDAKSMDVGSLLSLQAYIDLPCLACVFLEE